MPSFVALLTETGSHDLRQSKLLLSLVILANQSSSLLTAFIHSSFVYINRSSARAVTAQSYIILTPPNFQRQYLH